MKPKYLVMPVGPSGSGKTTLYKKLQTEYDDLVTFSWDALRLEWYCPEDYSKAFELACKDKKFYSKAMRVFMDMIEDGKNVYLDNMNLTPKSRREFIEAAELFGYKIVAYVLKFDLDTLLARQKTRGDKSVPESAVRDHVKRVEIPSLHEVDEVRHV